MSYRGICGALMGAAFILLTPWLRRKYSTGYDERTGNIPQVGGRAIWIHAVSVGEAQAAAPFVRIVRESGWPGKIVFSTTTPTGRRVAEVLMGGAVDRFIYYPWDSPRYIRHALDAINPAAYVAFETEIWPNLIYELSSRDVPSFIANGRLSERSLGRMEATRPFWADVMGHMAGIMARDEDEAERFIRAGADAGKITVTGDCKIDALLERAARSGGKKIPHGGPILAAGSTHPGEDEIILESYGLIRQVSADARLILAPRHPHRAAECVKLAEKYGDVALYSHTDEIWNILVVDEVGVLLELYGSAVCAFVGGSLVPKGGQNPMEPAALGVPVLHGPHMDDFASITSEMDGLDLSMTVRSPSHICGYFLDICSGRVKCPDAGDFFASRSGASARVWETVKGALPEFRN